MFRKLIASGAVALAISAGVAGAATYNITSVLDGTDASGFDYSMFHDQSSWRMSGNSIADPNPAGVTSGTWDSITGVISIGAQLLGAGSFVATGILNLNTSLTSGALTGISGYLDIVFTGVANIVDGTYRFTFADWLMDGSGAPNSFDSANDWISLWGDLDNDGIAGYDYTMRSCSPRYNQAIGQGQLSTCLGADLRLQLTPSPVPLPAGLVLMLTGLGGFAGLRRFRKARA